MFNKNKTNLKQSWIIINGIICKKKKIKFCTGFYISNKCTIKKQFIRGGFNFYFANIGPSLADKIPEFQNSTASSIDNMRDKITDIMFVQSVIESEAQALLKQLNFVSPGYDSISDFDFSLPSTHVLTCIPYRPTGVFPTEMKIAPVIPLLNIGDPMKSSSYRPIFVLPLFSKSFERLMYNRLILC